jgi:RimJ/RimL family protein N-acetyltransferase
MTLALRTPRLILREWRDDDVEPFAAMSSDPEIMRYLPAPDPEWIARQQRHFAEHGYGQWVLELPAADLFIGVVGLNRVRFPTPFTPATEVGWRLKRACWGHGYAFEAARAAIEDGFCRLGLSEIVAFTVPANTASWRLMERLGMSRNPAEDFDHPRFAEDHPLRRHLLYRLAAT